ncbi:histidine--tRNA ligase [Candidatus Woesearchaeota archaeon]|nr:histidine--tRNA ligase [Candidatus Woesearchaeota archaeon]
MEIERAKGTKEVDQKQKILMNYIVEVIKKNFELYGFLPLETPTLQRYDVLASKYAGGAEILKETFKLNDQGNRDLALRYDLTVPLCIYVALNPNVKLPFKRYEIGKVFRDGPVSVERYREFWQCDADIVGSANILSDVETINLGLKIFNELKLDVQFKVNNRKILDSVLESAGIPKDKETTSVLIIDKLEKIGIEGVKKELREDKLTDVQIEKLLRLVSVEGTNTEKLEFLKTKLNNKEGINEMEELVRYIPEIYFDPSLARGLSYYTGIIFEVKLNNSDVKSTITSGGRYDNIIGNFIGNNQKYPAIGISFGLDRIELAIKERKVEITKAYVIPIKQTEKAMEIVKALRDNGINSDLDLIGRSISKNLEYANTLGIPYAVIIGENEIKENKYTLRDMTTGKEEKLSVNELIKKLKNDK